MISINYYKILRKCAVLLCGAMSVYIITHCIPTGVLCGRSVDV